MAQETGGWRSQRARTGRNNPTACYRELGAELENHGEMAGLTGDHITRETG